MTEDKVKDIISIWYNLNKDNLRTVCNTNDVNDTFFTIQYISKKCILGIVSEIVVSKFELIISNGDISIKKC